MRLIRDALASADTPAEQLAEAVRQFARHHALANTEARVVNYELASLEPGPVAEIQELRRAIDGDIRALVRRGLADGSFDTPVPRIAATAILSLGIDIARWYRAEGSWTPEYVGDADAALALRIVGARPPAAPPGSRHPGDSS